MSRGRNPDISPEAKVAFEKSLSFVSKISKFLKNESVPAKASDSDGCISGSDDTDLSSTDKSNEFTINAEYSISTFHNVEDLDDIDSCLFEKVQLGF